MNVGVQQWCCFVLRWWGECGGKELVDQDFGMTVLFHICRNLEKRSLPGNYSFEESLLPITFCGWGLLTLFLFWPVPLTELRFFLALAIATISWQVSRLQNSTVSRCNFFRKFLPWGCPDQTAPFSEISHDFLLPAENLKLPVMTQNGFPSSLHTFKQRLVHLFIYPVPCTLVFASDVCLILT